MNIQESTKNKNKNNESEAYGGSVYQRILLTESTYNSHHTHVQALFVCAVYCAYVCTHMPHTQKEKVHVALDFWCNIHSNNL